jgi:hypothetical protein
LGSAHADLFISRKDGEVNYLVQQCAVAPELKCTSSVLFSRQQLKTMRRKIHWGLTRRLLSLHLTVPIYMRGPGFLFNDIDTLWVVRDGINTLLTGKEGVVQIPANAPGIKFLTEVVTEIVEKSKPVTPRPTAPRETGPATS